MKVSRVAEMRDLDSRATSEFGISQEALMEKAGEATHLVIQREFSISDRKFAIFCGTGNNGGDGFVVARRLHADGGRVKVFILGDKGKFGGASRRNLDIISEMPIAVTALESIDKAEEAVSDCDVIVDAMLGTGLSRDVGGIYKDAINLVNESGKKVFSIDIPSGVNGDTGQVMGAAVKSNYTIACGLPKIGNMLYPGFDLCGKLYVSHISFPPPLYNAESIKVEINELVKLPQRARDTHKGSYGKALFIAGSSNYLGAPYFSALSFLKAGGGLSYLATPKSISPFIASKGSEIVFIPQKETASGSLTLGSRDELLEFSKKMDMVILGPGLSLNEETQELVRGLVKGIKVPLLIDGDGITAVARDVNLTKERRAETILTPHGGEMSRITGTEVNEIGRDKVAVLQKTASELNAIIVLKGAHSLIGYPDERVYINTSGNPGMATAGSGDTLTGAIAAMYGLGLPLEEAVRIGVFMHGLSGDLAAEEKGEDGITAQDILDYLPNAVKHYRQNFRELSENFYESIYMV